MSTNAADEETGSAEAAAIALLRGVYAGLDVEQIALSFDELGLDSFERMAIRAALEERHGAHIPDADWVAMSSFSDLRDFLVSRPPPATSGQNAAQLAEREYQLNMPHMAIGGLGEGWLFRELGDVHWSMICDYLGRPSDDIQDDLGNRLYATFVRVRWEGAKALQDFRENDRLALRNELRRFGGSMFSSDCGVRRDGDAVIEAALLSTFARRGSRNTDLVKAKPMGRGAPGKREIELPLFAAEYRRARGSELDSVDLVGERVPIGADVIYECDYAVDPYRDFNGVNLLYFASYPQIADNCERRFVHDERRDLVRCDWALETSTIARDVFYLGNCEVDDTVVYRLQTFERTSNGRFLTAAALFRKSDGTQLATVVTVKAARE